MQDFFLLHVWLKKAARSTIAFVERLCVGTKQITELLAD
jgi:hypothetical protein